jgi:hypothetical protein
MKNTRFICNLAVIFFGLAFGLKFYFLSNGDVLNHYPLISPDGFDWYTEGMYLINSFFENDLTSLPVLRPPFFVLITLLDCLAGSKGLVLSIFYSLSIVMTYFFMLWIIDKEYGVKNNDAWFLFPLAISVTVYPINFVKGYLLSDSIAVCLSLCSVFILIKYLNENKKYLLFLSGALALLGGLTQTYALVPYLIFISIRLISKFKTNKANAFLLIANILLIFTSFILISYFWRYLLKHDSTPQNFELLKLSFGMLGFYINTWGYYFFPFLVFLIAIRYDATFRKKELILVSSTLVTLILGCMCFIYQWPEARFTYYFSPWVLISVFHLIKPTDERTASRLLVTLMLFASFLAPSNGPWQPSLKSLSLNYDQNWAVSYFKSKSVDRGLDECATPKCEGNEFIENSDQYVKSVMFMNLFLKELDIKFKK